MDTAIVETPATVAGAANSGRVRPYRLTVSAVCTPVAEVTAAIGYSVSRNGSHCYPDASLATRALRPYRRSHCRTAPPSRGARHT